MYFSFLNIFFSFHRSSHKRLLFMLQTQLMTSKSATMTLGLVEALLRLSEISSNGNISSAKGGQSLCSDNHELLHQCTKILSSRILVTSDVIFHRNVLKLLSHLVQNAKTKSKLEVEYKELAENSQELLAHCLVVLNIIQHLIESTTPISQAPKSQVDQTSITNPR